MPLTEAGGGLSGGQRQMLAIARMMLRDPSLVFLDEPTSMMDQTTEARVIEVLGKWLEGRTLVLSTHRLQLLAWVDRIAVMEHGQILVEGPREQVLKKLTAGVSQRAEQSKSKPSLKKEADAGVQTNLPTEPAAA